MELGNLFSGVFRDRKVLITGSSGFKGSWLKYWLLQMGANVIELSLAPDTFPNHSSLLFSTDNEYINIKKYCDVKNLLEQSQPEIVFHLAAQPLVRKSYAEPIDTFETNVIGTANIMAAIASINSVRVFVNITTDKVYKNKEWIWAYRETEELGGSDPYSASKACAELVHNSFFESFLKVKRVSCATVRAGNVIGGGDWAADRLIPDLIRGAVSCQKTSIRNRLSTRPWQHVLEPISGYLTLAKSMLSQTSFEQNSCWNFGPDLDGILTVQEIVELARNTWALIDVSFDNVEQQLKEANYLALDNTKAKKMLDWYPVWSISETVQNTIGWYYDFYNSSSIITARQLEQYVTDARRKNLDWAIS